MVKVGGPLLSLTAHGWLGRYTYARRGVVPTPYPIALLGFLRFPYRMPAWSLRPYASFISQYYSRLGWIYQRRRTWHGIVWSAMKPPISAQPNTALQNAYKTRFGDAVRVWQGMSQATKDIYHHWTYPARASGYNRFLRWYLLHTPVVLEVTGIKIAFLPDAELIVGNSLGGGIAIGYLPDAILAVVET